MSGLNTIFIVHDIAGGVGQELAVVSALFGRTKGFQLDGRQIGAPLIGKVPLSQVKPGVARCRKMQRLVGRLFGMCFGLLSYGFVEKATGSGAYALIGAIGGVIFARLFLVRLIAFRTSGDPATCHHSIVNAYGLCVVCGKVLPQQ